MMCILPAQHAAGDMLPETSCLHYLLPDKRDTSVTDRLRHARNFEPLKFRTV